MEFLILFWKSNKQIFFFCFEMIVVAFTLIKNSFSVEDEDDVVVAAPVVAVPAVVVVAADIVGGATAAVCAIC
jgi:hypothetical protein